MKLRQLSLRELFLLMVIAAMGRGWWVDHQRLAEASISQFGTCVPATITPLLTSFGTSQVWGL